MTLSPLGWPHCRLIIDAVPLSGAENMARDEVLLDAAVTADAPVLRWYQWVEPTLSLGYFQSREPLDQEARWQGVAAVRRLTGGGAILHDREWTYSCALPPRSPGLRHPYDLYDRIHAVCQEWFAEQGISLIPRGTTVVQDPEPFLCYSRADSHDLCVEGLKIVGSAQRRRKGALLQHGSLLLAASPVAPEIPGLLEATGQTFPSSAGDQLARKLAESLAATVVHVDWTPAEQIEAARLIHMKYGLTEYRNVSG